MSCNGELIFKYSSTSLPHPGMVIGRDVLILVKDNDLLRSFMMVNLTLFDRCNKFRSTADMWPDNAIEEL